MVSDGPRGTRFMLHLLQMWHWMGVVFVMCGRLEIIPFFDMVMIVSMETWPKRMCMSRRRSSGDIAFC